jgi:hypothetical protein
MVAWVRLDDDFSWERPYPGNVVSSYQMKSSWRPSDWTDCPCLPANQTALSPPSVSQRPPTDHCAIPRPGPPYWTEVGVTLDSWIRFPTMPAAW